MVRCYDRCKSLPFIHGGEGRFIPSTGSAIIKEIEAVIGQVKGVVSAQVVCDNNSIAEIHVLADDSRTPKQIVRDIESATLVKLGTVLDHKQISVAQLGQKTERRGGRGSRFQFDRISCSTGSAEIDVAISLRLDDEMFTAAAAGPNTRQYRLRLVAEATLRAVEQYLGGINRFVAVDVQKVWIAGQEIIVVLTSLCLGSAEEILAGTAPNRGDEIGSTVRATLDAINRRLNTIERV